MALDQTMLSYYLYRLAGAIVPRLPPFWGYRLFAQLGDLVFRLYKESRTSVWDNVSHVLGPAAGVRQQARVVRGIFRSQARNYYDLLRLPSLSDAKIKKLVTLHGLENLQAALSSGRGVVMVTAHFGNIDVVAQALLLHGYPVTGVAEHLKPEALYRYVCSLRASKGINLVPADSDLKLLFRALAQNQIVGLAADRDTTESGIVVDFFGASARLPDGYLQLALRTGAALVPCFGLRQPGDTFVGYIEPAVPLEKTGDLKHDVRLNMGRVLPVIERYIATHPDQWVMFQPVWKSHDRRMDIE